MPDRSRGAALDLTKRQLETAFHRPTHQAWIPPILPFTPRFPDVFAFVPVRTFPECRFSSSVPAMCLRRSSNGSRLTMPRVRPAAHTPQQSAENDVRCRCDRDACGHGVCLGNTRCEDRGSVGTPVEGQDTSRRGLAYKHIITSRALGIHHSSTCLQWRRSMCTR